MAVKVTNPFKILEEEPWAFLIYGEPKVGKTTLAGQFPGVVIIACPVNEATSLASLPNAQDIPVYGVETWEDCCKAALNLARKPRTEEFQTLVFDNLTYAYNLCVEQVVEEQTRKVISEATWTAANRKFIDFLDNLLFANRGKNTILVAHNRVDIIGEGKDASTKIRPDFGGSLSRKIVGRLNAVFYYRMAAGNKRELITSAVPGVDVGSRYKLPRSLTDPTADAIIRMLEEYKQAVMSRAEQKEAEPNGS